MVLSGEQCIHSSNGTKEKISAGYFTLKDFRNCDQKLVTTSETAERYFILMEANPLLDSMLRVMFPAGLPGFTAPAPEKLKAFFEDIRNRIAEKDASDSNISGAAYTLLHEVMRQLPANKLPQPVLLACEYIDSNFQRSDLSREEIARYACVSVSTLAALFRKHQNTTIWQRISDKRMTAVKQQLTFSNKTIEEIAALCGFSYAYYLTREFKSRCNMTPSEYRKISRSNE